jgi:hypothetical protein
MAESKTKKRRVNEIVILAIVLVCMALILLEMTSNVSNAINTQENQAVVEINDVTPSAVPTLTEEEYQEMIGIENAGAGGQVEP